jgi:hypothetical protein
MILTFSIRENTTTQNTGSTSAERDLLGKKIANYADSEMVALPVMYYIPINL